MIHEFIDLIVAVMGLFCLSASVKSWFDTGKMVPEILWWVAGYSLFLVSAVLFLFDATPVVFSLRYTFLYCSFTFQLIGLLLFHGLGPRWTQIVPAVGGLAATAVSSLLFSSVPHLQELAANLFAPILALTAIGHLLFRPVSGRNPVPKSFLVLFALFSTLGMFRFFMALVWIHPEFWFNCGIGDDFSSLAVQCLLVGLAYYQTLLIHRVLRKELDFKERELARSQQDILTTLAEVIENSSHETAGHVYRVGQYAAILGTALGMTPDEIRLLAEAAPLHDIGKIGIPERILEKNSPLDKAEWDCVRNHPALGHSILVRSDSPLFRLAARIALEHHENWDGSGYPRGLSGLEISKEGRIVALCDVLDALSHRRSYKTPWSKEQILQYLSDQRGRKFDPDMTDVLLANAELFLGRTEESRPDEATA